MCPRRVSDSATGSVSSAQLDRDDAGRGVREQLPVVADEEDRLLRLPDPPLQPQLAGDVEEVVGLVEQEHLVRPVEEELEDQPLLLAPGEGREVAVLRPVVGDAEGRGAADVPGDLELVAAGVAPLGECRGVAHLRRLVVGLHERQLAALHLLGRPTGALGRDREEQLSHGGGAAPDHLAHDPEAAGAGHHTGVRDQLSGDDAQQGGLAGAVRPDESDLGALPHPERDVVEQHPPVRQLVADSCDVDVSHERP